MDLIHAFDRRGIFYWNQVIREWLGHIPIWKRANELGLSGQIALEWEHIRNMMKSIRICRDGQGDHITCAGKKKIGEIEVVDTY